jgi:hypothetical protein
MNKATPVQMRKILEVVGIMKSEMIRFIPMPVLSELDNDHLAGMMRDRMERLACMAEGKQ